MLIYTEEEKQITWVRKEQFILADQIPGLLAMAHSQHWGLFSGCYGSKSFVPV